MELRYVIGDIHGCSDLLRALLLRLSEHAAGRPYTLIFLGDYVDRGPDSAGVIAILRGLQGTSPGRVVCLQGNHEAMLLAALQSTAAEEFWEQNGGRETLASFRAARAGDLPNDVIAWIAGLPTFFQTSSHYCVHAGLHPALPLSQQTDQFRLWMREPFLSADQDFGLHVVHGHSALASGRPEVLRHRTNIDTGAVYGGPLTAAVLVDGHPQPVDFIQANMSDLARPVRRRAGEIGRTLSRVFSLR
jgi:serine/threonine protein phosphatase 1